MRVCQVVDRLTGGGQERIAVELSRMVAGHVELSSVLATRAGGDYEVILRKAGVVSFIGDRRHRLDIAGWGRVARWVREMRFDVLHVHSPGSLMAAVLLKRIFFLPFKVVLHVQMLPPAGTRWRTEAVRMLRWGRKTVSFAFTTNRKLRNYLVCHCGYPEHSVALLHNPTDFAAAARIPRRRLELAGGRPVVIMVAQWRPQKDHETAIRAAASLRRRGMESVWVFVGEEQCPEIVEQARRLASELKVADLIHILGRRRDVLNLLAGADVAVLATHFEGLPVAVMEYAAMGLPCVVSDVEGTEDLIDPDAGILGVPPRDPEVLADMVAKLISDPARSAELGARARLHLQAVADVSAVRVRVLEVYRTITATDRPPAGTR